MFHKKKMLLPFLILDSVYSSAKESQKYMISNRYLTSFLYSGTYGIL